jgi:hypothetical protein
VVPTLSTLGKSLTDSKMDIKEAKKEKLKQSKKEIIIRETVYLLRAFSVETVQYFISGTVYTLMTSVVPLYRR